MVVLCVLDVVFSILGLIFFTLGYFFRPWGRDVNVTSGLIIFLPAT
jgi:hypothetical protein